MTSILSLLILSCELFLHADTVHPLLFRIPRTGRRVVFAAASRTLIVVQSPCIDEIWIALVAFAALEWPRRVLVLVDLVGTPRATPAFGGVSCCRASKARRFVGE